MALCKIVQQVNRFKFLILHAEINLLLWFSMND